MKISMIQCPHFATAVQGKTHAENYYFWIKKCDLTLENTVHNKVYCIKLQIVRLFHLPLSATHTLCTIYTHMQHT